MPRYARIAGPNLFYHLMNRGIEKRAIFRKSGDYDKFMSYLSICNKKFDWSIYCYCIMPNHFHLLVRTRTHPLGHIMKSLQTSYGVYFNKKYKRVGPVFSGRFKSIICQEDSYFLQVSKYIHLNPVKIIDSGWKENGISNRIVAKEYLSKYMYSSYQEYLGVLRKEWKILNRPAFPEYFIDPHDFEGFIEYWMKFKEEEL